MMKRATSFAVTGLIVSMLTGGSLLHAEVPASGPSASPTSQPAEILAAEGLSKTGALYLLRADKEVTDGARQIAVARRKMEDENRNRKGLEDKIRMAKSELARLDFQQRGLDEKLATVKDVTQNNQLVGQINSIGSKMREGMEFKETQEKELRKIGDEAKNSYVNLVLDLSSKADKTVAEYARLGAKNEVKTSLESVKGKLGPSPEFVAQAASLKRLRSTMNSDVVKVKVENGVPMVEVTLNGGTTRNMVVDSGSSIVAIPADLAKALELIPPKDAPILHLQMADGKIVAAKQMTLKSVRVGTFTVENVDCAILPPELISAEPLLGGSFLKNFIYKLNLDAEELHLSQIGVKPDSKTPAK